MKSFIFSEETSVELLHDQLREEFELKELDQTSFREVFYDTFDWRLAGKGCVLKRKGKKFLLEKEQGQEKISEEGAARKRLFAKDFPVGEFRHLLESIVDVRALLATVSLEGERCRYSLRNGDGKTVSWLYLDTVVIESDGYQPAGLHIVSVDDVRGYEKSFDLATSMVLHNGGIASGNAEGILVAAMAAIGKPFFDYSSKFSVTLAPQVTVGQAVSSICTNLLQIIERNYDGVLADIDPEFLHDFRVAIRRTRSLIDQLKAVLPKDIREYFSSEFKWLGSITGVVRDLDVYLMEEDNYRKILPQNLHHGLEAFFDDLRSMRRVRLAQMKKELRSSRYVELCRSWSEFLQDKERGDAWLQQHEMMRPVAEKVIRKRFKRIVKGGQAITSHSPDEALHKLRIQGKKLRYLLEFFHDYYDHDEVGYFLKQLKRLQNNLGDFNDLSVQQEMLISYRATLGSGGKKNIDIAAALGGLLTHLSGEHYKVRAQFADTFTGFASLENIERFSRVFTV